MTPNKFEYIRENEWIKCPKFTGYSTKENEIMAFKHDRNNIHVIQYHTEAYLTEHGLEILSNFLGEG